MVAVRVVLLTMHSKNILRRMAHSLDLRSSKWGRALVQVGDIAVSICVSPDVRCMALNCCEGWLMGANHPYLTRSG